MRPVSLGGIFAINFFSFANKGKHLCYTFFHHFSYNEYKQSHLSSLELRKRLAFVKVPLHLFSNPICWCATMIMSRRLS